MPDAAGSVDPVMLETKSQNPPPFMPDAAASHQVSAAQASTSTLPPPDSASTSTVTPSGLMQAAMPLLSGVQHAFGQAENFVGKEGAQIQNGAQQVLHLPGKKESNTQKGAAGTMAPPQSTVTKAVSGSVAALEAKTAEAKLKFEQAEQARMRIEAELAEVKAKLNAGSPEGAKAASKPESPEPSKATANTDSSNSESVKASPKKASPEPSEDEVKMVQSKVKKEHPESVKPKLRKSSTKDANFKRLFEPGKLSVTLAAHGKTIVLGCALVAVGVVLALVSRFVAARSQASSSIEQSNESALE